MRHLIFIIVVLLCVIQISCNNSDHSASKVENDTSSIVEDDTSFVWRPLKANLKTNSFTIHGDTLIEFNRDGDFEAVETNEGVVFRANDGTITITCRCPLGFGGSCELRGIPGGPIRYCKGDCTHTEVPTLKTSCGFFAGGKRRKLATLNWFIGPI